MVLCVYMYTTYAVILYIALYTVFLTCLSVCIVTDILHSPVQRWLLGFMYIKSILFMKIQLYFSKSYFLFFLRPHVSPIRVFGCRNGEFKYINTYRSNGWEGSIHNSNEGAVKMRCGQSHCNYNIMVYRISQVPA